MNGDSLPLSKSYRNQSSLKDPFKDPLTPTKQRNHSLNSYKNGTNGTTHNPDDVNLNGHSVGWKPEVGLGAQEKMEEEEADAIRYEDDFGSRGPAKVLYDYSPIESDELTLSKGV